MTNVRVFDIIAPGRLIGDLVAMYGKLNKWIEFISTEIMHYEESYCTVP
jgi:hypothetical protein